ncbi:hypothetical protein ACEQPO_28695 [Bacillus sp. SL00103]
MFMVGQDVAAAIVDQQPKCLTTMPNEMPKTGMGGTAGPLGMSYEAFAGLIASLILAGGAMGVLPYSPQDIKLSSHIKQKGERAQSCRLSFKGGRLT